MRYLKKKGYEGTIRKVVSEDRSKVYGIVGTVEDMLKEGILEYYDGSETQWCMISSCWDGAVWFGSDRQDVVDYCMLYVEDQGLE